MYTNILIVFISTSAWAEIIASCPISMNHPSECVGVCIVRVLLLCCGVCGLCVWECVVVLWFSDDILSFFLSPSFNERSADAATVSMSVVQEQ